jgi:hypothetical protein
MYTLNRSTGVRRITDLYKRLPAPKAGSGRIVTCEVRECGQGSGVLSG